MRFQTPAVLFLFCLSFFATGQKLAMPRLGIKASEIAVIVNANYTNSSDIAAEFVSARRIPAGNVFTLGLGSTSSVVRGIFLDQYQTKFLDQVGGLEGAKRFQAFVLAFSKPYRVECESITSAFALGFNDTLYCGNYPPCTGTKYVNYFDSESVHPFDTHGLRPAIVISGRSRTEAAKLIANGVAADGSHPVGRTGYLVRTTDPARSVRYWDMMSLASTWKMNESVTWQYLEYPLYDAIFNTTDVASYFTGLASVPLIATNTYIPGAVCDHLTSYGGMLYDSGQMPANKWIEAGCTGSYGTVVEPCNFNGKLFVSFPSFNSRRTDPDESMDSEALGFPRLPITTSGAEA